MLPSPAGSFLAIAIISSHVSGGLGTRSLRYQSSWTLVFSRDRRRSCPSRSRTPSGPSRTSSSASSFSAPVELAQPAGLRELRSPDRVHVDDVDVLVAGREAADEQLARRVGAVGHRRCLIVYLPLDWSLHSLAAFAFVPPGSSGPSRLRVTGPPLDPPHPAATMAHAAAREAAPTPMPLRLILLLSSRRPVLPLTSGTTRFRAPERHHIAAPGSSVSRVCPAVV